MSASASSGGGSDSSTPYLGMQSMLELSPYALYQAGHLPIQAVLTEKLQSALALCRTPTVSADVVAS